MEGDEDPSVDVVDDDVIVYVRHVDPNDTGEGLGSYARGSLYPLLRVSLSLGWPILWHRQRGFGADNQTRPSYEEECDRLGEWLFLNDGDDTDDVVDDDIDDDAGSRERKERSESSQRLIRYEDLDVNRLTVVPIDLDDDGRLGRIGGYAGILITSIQGHIAEHGPRMFYNLQPFKRRRRRRQQPSSPPTIVLVSLHGRFQYQDDPSPIVVEWMQTKGRSWQKKYERRRRQQQLQYQKSMGTAGDSSSDGSSGIEIRVAAHIRVPEDYCNQIWKDANSVHHLVDTLTVLDDQLRRQWRHLHPTSETTTTTTTTPSSIKVLLDVFTEDTFSDEQEATLCRGLDRLGLLDGTVSTNTVRIHRQSPLLTTVERMATADVFIPASSYLSAFAAFFQTSLILMPDEATRRDRYLAPHLRYGAASSSNGSPPPTAAEPPLGGGQPCVPQVPIVPIQGDDTALERAIERLLLVAAESSHNGS